MSVFILGFIASSIGVSYFIYGKKAPDGPFLISGILLMVYPYVVNSVWATISIGLAIIIAPFIIKKIF